MATANGSGNARWAPPPGRHKVDVGGSLKRALRARKGAPAPTNKNMPMSDYYLFRCECRRHSLSVDAPQRDAVARSPVSAGVVTPLLLMWC